MDPCAPSAVDLCLRPISGVISKLKIIKIETVESMDIKLQEKNIISMGTPMKIYFTTVNRFGGHIYRKDFCASEVRILYYDLTSIVSHIIG